MHLQMLQVLVLRVRWGQISGRGAQGKEQELQAQTPQRDTEGDTALS